MEAAGAVDAQNAPTAPCKTRRRVSHSYHRPSSRGPQVNKCHPCSRFTLLPMFPVAPSVSSNPPGEGMFVRVSKDRISSPRIEERPHSPGLQRMFERTRFDPIASCRVRRLVDDSQTGRNLSEHRSPVRSLHEVFKPRGNLVAGFESTVQKVVILWILQKALDQIVGHEPTVLLSGRLRMDPGPMRCGECVHPRASTEIATNPALILTPRNRGRASQCDFDFSAQIHRVRLTNGAQPRGGFERFGFRRRAPARRLQRLGSRLLA